MWKEAEKFLLKDKYIEPLIEKWGSCRIKPRHNSDYFEHLCSNIIGQQLSGKAADTIFASFKKQLGIINPENIIKIKDQDLRDSGLSWGKVSYVKDLAEKVASNKLQVTRMHELSDEEVIKELTEVKGIGRWTAEMFLMFTLGRPDIFPVDDLGIKKGYEKVTGKKWDKIKSAKFAEKHWKPYRTVASWYLWRSLE